MKTEFLDIAEAKKLIIHFFKESGYNLWRDNDEDNRIQNKISMLFTTNKNGGADPRVLDYAPHIQGWTIDKEHVQDDTIAITFVKDKQPLLRRIFSKSSTN
ncbi:hypothetical protein ABQ284_11775 [Lentilactobacillus buchneri]|uniref:hypothetical protein n=1 Tax=Lentilactobacillus buchneri TaxID=1581 RepID=UPI0030F10377